MHTTALFLTFVYIAASLGLLVYSVNCYVLLGLFLRRYRGGQKWSEQIIQESSPAFDEGENLPIVTTQIPVFNELNVVERAIRSAAAIDYPKARHQIQLLDDSTDETCELVDRIADELRAKGHWIDILHRTVRPGFKAGALQEAMPFVAGEYIAIFDADFIPPSNFFRRTLPFFLHDSKMGLVQARWGHLNSQQSILTRAQGMGIDGHFMIEQTARTFNGLFMNFNGTAGLWRKTAIVGAGGWSADTLTEDLDLAYRSQLAGWHTHFVSQVEVPGELPASVTAFKSQQFRWAKGSMQTALKILPLVLHSRVSAWAKLQAAFHLTHYIVHPFMLIVALLAVPMMLALPGTHSTLLTGIMVAVMALSMAAPNAMYIVSQRVLYPDWKKRICWLPALMAVGTGLAISNTRAVLEAFTGKASDFIRTPKQGDQAVKTYRVAASVLPWLEIAMGAYCVATLWVNFATRKYAVIPFMFFYAVGFLLIGLGSLREQRVARSPLPKAARVPVGKEAVYPQMSPTAVK